MENKISMFRRILNNLSAHIWWRLPITREQKEVVKTFVFTHFSLLFGNTIVYRNWENGRFLLVNEIDNTKETVSFHLKNIYKNTAISSEPTSSIAVIIHVFYLEIFDDLLANITKNTFVDFKFYITSPIELSEEIYQRLKKRNIEYEYLSVENKGRDILPFLKIIPKVLQDGFQIILKIHTKKSVHLKTGFIWRNDLYKKLLREKAMTSTLNLFNTAPEIGMLGPEGHIVPMNLYYGANSERLKAICVAFKISIQQLYDMNFVAGSMFYVRSQALIPLLNLDLQTADFESELGQLDGTLAHVIERAFAISTYASGFTLVDSAYHLQAGKVCSTLNYKFTR